MRVISCLFEDHNLWLVALAAAVCVSGCWVTFRLFERALKSGGTLQRAGWLFQTSVAAGSSVWCTHFVAVLAYDAKAPVFFDPLLTAVSLVIAIAGLGLGFAVASQVRRRLAPEIGGAIVGAAIPAMHYTGMAAYHIDGIVEWSVPYVIVSVAASAVLSSLSISVAVRRLVAHSSYVAILLLVLAIVSLHFTAMAAVSVYPLLSVVSATDPAILEAMAVAIVAVASFVIGTGVASYLVDEQSRSENFRKLQHMALNDALTGLPNRTSFGEHLDHEIREASQHGWHIAVVGIDLDRFKEINDLRGHGAGDQALCIVGERLGEALRENEFAARVGGDEFGATKRFTDQKDLMDFVGRLETALFEPIELDDFTSTSGASIGVAVYPEDGATRETLIGNADLAMYRAKIDIGRTVCFYESKLDEAARERRSLANDLRQAIERAEFELHYQVQTSVVSGDICGYEVLLRWRHPEHGMIPPLKFIPIAEETGSILAIGEWVLREACKQAATWNKPFKIAVNISPVQFAHAELPRLIHRILLETGLSPARLELEITESTIIADKARTLHTLRQIRALGVTIALDDFGTGYSSLDTLRSFPFDKIKLDRSFMNEVESSPQSKAIVRAVLALGKSLNIPVLAEGVETSDQLTILRREGCDEAQGYLLGRPKPPDQIFTNTPAAAEAKVA
jgi:diguanylate cyclase (GGDEF)-like protein